MLLLLSLLRWSLSTRNLPPQSDSWRRPSVTSLHRWVPHPLPHHPMLTLCLHPVLTLYLRPVLPSCHLAPHLPTYS